MKKCLVVLLTVLLISMMHIYGDSKSLNAGLAIGPSDTCQVGYEYRGDVGFFASCEM